MDIIKQKEEDYLEVHFIQSTGKDTYEVETMQNKWGFRESTLSDEHRSQTQSS